MLKIKRALISVSDKTEIISLAKGLTSFGCEIISTGGTLKVLENAGIPVLDISTITKNPEAFGGRVKTLSFQVSASILFNRETDVKEAKKLEIIPIDLVICNLYPFAKAKESNASFDTLIENIDIGGPTMIRSAAKNFKGVAVVTDPKDYLDLIEEMNLNKGNISLATRKRLMQKAFNYTADYDAMIATTMDAIDDINSIRMVFTNGQSLRYGENSHQKAFFFKDKNVKNSLFDMNILHGKQLSYNNIVDINSAILAVSDLKRCGCAVIKHNTPCGLSESLTAKKALELAWASDPVSAFGSVIAFNCEVTSETVDFFQLDNPDKNKRKFIEVIIAPNFSQNALNKLRFHKNLRVIEYDTTKKTFGHDFKFLNGALLKQDIDEPLATDFKCVSKKAPISFDRDLMEFGIKAVKQVKSNAIVIVRRLDDDSLQLLGMGTGQPNRLTAVSLAVEKSKSNLMFKNLDEIPHRVRDDIVVSSRKMGSDLMSSRNSRRKLMSSRKTRSVYPGSILKDDHIDKILGESILVSEAFFPFPDSVELCAGHGIKTILQPGGSIKDNDVIQRCDDLELSMIFTGLRHFKH